MAAFADADLKKWREKRGISAAEVAEHVNCDVTTIYRYERGQMNPDPDVMYQICEFLGDVGIWQDWMRTEYPTSYGRIHPVQGHDTDPRGAVMRMFVEANDLIAISQDVFRDLADGRIDDDETREELLAISQKLLQSSQNLMNLALIKKV